MNRKMVDAVLEMSEYNRFSKGIFGWVGFRTKWLEYENIERSAGETKWNVKKLFIYSLEGITGFSVVPLSIASYMGVLVLRIIIPDDRCNRSSYTDLGRSGWPDGRRWSVSCSVWAVYSFCVPEFWDSILPRHTWK